MIFEDNVNHPEHYQGKNECIDVMLAMFGVEAVKHFCMCNAYKYRFRAGMKNGAEDIEKAEWYESKLIELGGVDECIKNKTCPFCGGEGYINYERIPGEDKGCWAQVICKKCHARSCGTWSNFYENAEKREINAWNRRANNGKID